MKVPAAAAMLCAILISPAAAATLSQAQTRALTAYLSNLQHANYAAAYALLATSQQHYFRTAQNFASVFTADRYTLRSFKISGVPAAGSNGSVVSVDEKISVFDPAHQTTLTATTPAYYGIVSENGSVRIRDPRHPWKSFVPASASATRDNVSVTVRKVSLYRDRIEVIATFANASDVATTFFAYGRSVMHDEANRVYRPIESRIAARLDNELFLGLRLPPSAQYTGVLAFRFADAAVVPQRLDLTVAPIVREGGDAPVDLSVPSMAVPG